VLNRLYTRHQIVGIANPRLERIATSGMELLYLLKAVGQSEAKAVARRSDPTGLDDSAAS